MSLDQTARETRSQKERIGIVGVPPRAVIADLCDRGVTILDLDEPQPGVSLEAASPVPRAYCAILRTVVANAVSLDLTGIVVDVGPGKCDGARAVAAILEDLLGIPVRCCENRDQEQLGNPICTSTAPLVDKLLAITQGVRRPAPASPRAVCRPSAGFWGVPPRDFSLLALFPDTTHVYGWSRCMENKTPADFELECLVNPAVPTVFFAQAFCAKTALARHLASRHPRGLYLDADVAASASLRAKIEAFLELSGVAP
ncbi:MAG: hypothetical protein AB1634_12445 [Thermodesulfobacteriota bacterium]